MIDQHGMLRLISYRQAIFNGFYRECEETAPAPCKACPKHNNCRLEHMPFGVTFPLGNSNAKEVVW